MVITKSLIIECDDCHKTTIYVGVSVDAARTAAMQAGWFHYGKKDICEPCQTIRASEPE